MRYAAVLALGLTISVTGFPVLAQDWQNVGRRTTPTGMHYLGGFAISGMNGVWRHDIYAVRIPTPERPHGPGTRRYVIRKSLNNPDGLEQFSWADGRTCTAVAEVLDAFDDFGAIYVVLPGYQRATPPDSLRMIPPPAPPLHGRTFSIWGSGRTTSQGAFVDMAVSGQTGELRTFGERAEAQLESCWSEAGPPA